MTNTELDLQYLRDHLQMSDLVPYQWNGEDRNLGAFRSQEELVAWYSQPPGKVNEPYRDRAFYCRELAHVSRIVQPRTIVEFGTSLGIGTCLLHWLNPEATLTTVDINTETFLPGNQHVPMGHLAKHQRIPCKFVTCQSWNYSQSGIDLCFIDGDHSFEAVTKDTKTAWINASLCEHKWGIIWHDHNDRHPGVMQAVKEFCEAWGIELQSRHDSDTVWITGD